jgi:DNA-binding response OmpR family regulator
MFVRRQPRRKRGARLKFLRTNRRYIAMTVTTSPAPDERRQSVRVLWADDDPMIRSVMALNLEAEGFDVQTVADGDAAYEEAVRIPPDVLVLDIMMPGQDGYSVLRALRLNPDTAELPVVLLTAKATDAEVWEGWKAGADYYITKPFDPTELTDFIDHLLFDSATEDATSPPRGNHP